MNLAIVGKETTTTNIKSIITSRIDNIKVECFPDLQTYHQIVSSRNWKIDRLIILQDGLPTEDTKNYMMRFQKYVDERNAKTNIIFIIKDLNVAEALSAIFVSMFHCIIYTTTMTPPQLVQIGSETIDTVRERYGYKTQMVEAEKTYMEDVTQKPKPKEKKGFLSGLFGKKSKGSVESGQQPQDTGMEDLEELDDVSIATIEYPDTENLENLTVPEFTDTASEVAFDRVLEENRKKSEEFYKEGQDQVQGLDNEGQVTYVDEQVTSIEAQDPPSTAVPTTNEGIWGTETDGWGVQNESTTHYEQSVHKEPVESVYTHVEKTHVEPVETVQETYTSDTETPIWEDTEQIIQPQLHEQDSTVQQSIKTVDDMQLTTVFTEDVTSIDESNQEIDQTLAGIDSKLQELTIEQDIHTEDIYNPDVKQVTEEQGVVIEQAKNEGLGVNIRNLELAYEEISKPKQEHVEKVVDESPVNRGIVAGMGGRRNIIVTGDRGSGLTSTALTLASMLARQQPTLYVDFDTEMKGFLYYAGIDNIIQEDDYVQAGLVHLHRHDNVKAVTYRYHKGGFDVLLSFFDAGVEDTDINRVQKILTIQKDYKNVVIDCPIDKLHLLTDMIEQATILVCTRVKLKALVTTLTKMSTASDSSSLRYNLYKNSRFLITDGVHPELLVKHLLYIQDLFSMGEEEIDWTEIPFIGSTQNMLALVEKLKG